MSALSVAVSTIFIQDVWVVWVFFFTSLLFPPLNYTRSFCFIEHVFIAMFGSVDFLNFILLFYVLSAFIFTTFLDLFQINLLMFLINKLAS